MLYLAEVLFPMAASAFRLSVLMLYHAIFGSGNKLFNNALKALGAQWILLVIVGFFCMVFQCVPVSYAWTTNHSERCLDLERTVFYLTLYSIFLSTATLVLPLPLIWKLQLSLRRKLALGVLFALGGA